MVKNVPGDYYGMDCNFCYWDVGNIHLHVMSHHSTQLFKCVFYQDKYCKSMASSKTVISPLQTHWRYHGIKFIEMAPWDAYHLELLYWYNPHGTIPPGRPTKLARHYTMFLCNGRCLRPCSRRRHSRIYGHGLYLTAMWSFGGPRSLQNVK